MPLDFATLSADTAHRFRAVAELLQSHGGDFEGRPSLLDVGGYPGVFVREFTKAFPRWTGTTLDTPAEELPNYISGTGDKMPFGDESFDAVTSIDTLEHIPPDHRGPFLSELCRVSRNLVVVAAPFHHASTAAVERLLNDAHRELFGAEHPWLHEHVANGLPKLRPILEEWPTDFPVVEIKKSYDLQAWTTWQVMSIYRKLRGETDKAWAAYDGAAASAVTPRITEVPYRYILVARREGKPVDLTRFMVPVPDAGTEVVELARLFCRMLQLSVGVPGSASGEVPAGLIDERLKEALSAAEGEIRRLQSALPRKNPTTTPTQPTNSSTSGIRRFFTKGS